jgi:hypothetical protein
MTGSETSRLLLLRGDSGSGKSSVAAGLRARYGKGIALVDTVARYSLDQGFHVIVEGILNAARYGAMLDALFRDHRGASLAYYLDVPFEETLARHATRPSAADFGEVEMRSWYRPLDLLPTVQEQIIPAASSLSESVERIYGDARLPPPRTEGTWGRAM